jgi:hypothetical protein
MAFFAATAGAKDRAGLWRDPDDPARRDLIYGAGGRTHAPAESGYVFVEEDLDGNSPKFVVEDAKGVRWKVKLGPEVRPEVSATRLVWAAGYFTDEDYFLPAIKVRNMPSKLRRGREFVSADGSVREVRLERLHLEKAGHWKWGGNPFDETRELNGLRVLMALLNNYDLKDSNNAVYQTPSGRVYLVADLGATFGATGSKWPSESQRGNPDVYRRSDFIQKVTGEYVNFAAPSWQMMFGLVPTPPLPYPWLTAPVKLFGREPFPDVAGQRWIGKGIPRADVRWIAGLLGRLSAKQIRDAFRAARYPAAEVEGFSQAVELRIARLSEI